MSEAEHAAGLIPPELDETVDLMRVAYAIARVVAKRTLDEDAALQRLDALGKASAVHTMAVNMTPRLMDEAQAAVDAVLRQVGEKRKQERSDEYDPSAARPAESGGGTQ